MPSANAAVPAAGGTEDFLSWEGYDIPDQLKAWREKNGVEVKATYIANHDEIQAKLMAGGGSQGYDIITYYQGYRPLYTELEILEPLDDEKIPNLVNLLPYFASGDKEFWVDADGTRTGMPWTWGSIGITYDSAVVTTEPTSWYELLDPKLEGQGRAARRPGRLLHARVARARQGSARHPQGRARRRSSTSLTQIIGPVQVHRRRRFGDLDHEARRRATWRC